MENRKTTLKDVAQATGYSINTISKALKDKGDIAKDTRAKIKATAKEMGYINNSIAGALRSGMTKTIAIILGDISNPHFSIMVKEIENRARDFHYSTFILNTEEDMELEEKAIYTALGKKVDGMIICPVQKDASTIAYLQKTQVPFVLIGRHFDSLKTDYVVCNDLQGGYLATKHLLDYGHRRIAFFNGPDYISSARERLLGYQKALAEYDVPYDSRIVYQVPLEASRKSEQIRAILSREADYTAIFAFSDITAWEIIALLQEKSVKVPEDISVVGFDDIQSKFMFPFPLTSIRSFKSLMSIEATDLLIDKINNGDVGGVTERIIATGVEMRSSTRKV